MYADIFSVCSCQFFITVTKPLDHLLCTPIESRDTLSLRSALKKHLDYYGQRAIKVTKLNSDNERGLIALTSDLAAAGITPVNSSTTGLHTLTETVIWSMALTNMSPLGPQITLWQLAP